VVDVGKDQTPAAAVAVAAAAADVVSTGYVFLEAVQ
jgi:hypothetical protein